MQYPHEFLGRCPTCLENCFLDDSCMAATPNFPFGVPNDECKVRRDQEAYRSNAPIKDADKEAIRLALSRAIKAEQAFLYICEDGNGDPDAAEQSRRNISAWKRIIVSSY